MLRTAVDFLYETAKKGEQIIFVGTKKQAREVIELEAKRCGAMYVTERWIGGTITNFKVIKKNIDKLVSFMKRREEGDLDKYTKKERLLIDREIEKLQKNIGGIILLKGAPKALFVVDARRERTAIAEAKRAGVPVVALIDTNSDPSMVNYVIPGNDDAIKSVALILKTIGDAVEEGYKDFEKGMTEAAVVAEAPAVPAEEDKEDMAKVTVAEAPRVAEEPIIDEVIVEKAVIKETTEKKADKVKKIKISKEDEK
jgi:small subunit ribosomal protein S2